MPHSVRNGAREEPFMTVAQVADELRVSRAHCYRLVVLGRIPAVHRGRSVLVPTEAWRAWLRRQTDAALRALENAGRRAPGSPGGVSPRGGR